MIATAKKPTAYDEYKQKQAAISRDKSEKGREIGPPPDVRRPRVKNKARNDFRYFCEKYFPDVFTLGWSCDHLKVIRKIEQAVIHGGLFAMAMPRGSGKTTLAECACIWAILYGHRSFVVLIGSDEGSSKEMLNSIKAEFENNDLLFGDFPEAVWPIVALEGIAHRCKGQICEGTRTQMVWTADTLVMPTVKKSKASGAIVRVAGITGRIRGMKFKRPDGRSVRPDLVIPDDPQTDESARSPSQCATRESILAGAVLGLAGPGKKIAGVMPCTVIRPNDMADSILDRDKHPDWQGERTRMVNSWPKNEELWHKYGEIRANDLQSGGDGSAATDFYREHLEEMNAGADVAWPDRHNPEELSAIQHAWNLRLRDERAFFAEYQNDPLPDVEEDLGILSADEICQRLSGLQRGRIGNACQTLTAFIDVQKDILYWLVAAWEDTFTGYIVDYGTYPDQNQAYFSLIQARHTLSREFPNTSLEGTLFSGLEKLCCNLLSRKWKRDDGAELSIDRCLIDANWGASTDTVYKFCRQSQYAQVMPSHGKYVGASGKPMHEAKRQRGGKYGLNWMIPPVQGKRVVRHAVYDTNFWKTFVHLRLATSVGSPGSLTLYGHDSKIHRMLADHLTAEYRVKTEGRGRTVDEWQVRPDRPDNHFFDCLVGSAVAASIAGVTLPEHQRQGAAIEKRRKLTLSELRARKQR